MIMKPEFFDIHSHVQDISFDPDRIDVIKKMEDEKVWSIVVGTDNVSSQQALSLALFFDHLFASVGIHPRDNPMDQFIESYFRDLLEKDKVVAVGECGLDYYRMKDITKEEKDRQKNLFEAQLELAVSVNRPLMIHCRPSQGTEDAHEEMIDMLSSKKRTYGDKLWGDIHFFTSSAEIAKRYFEMGFTVSFPGVITFTNDYDNVVKYAPLDMILSETDSPYAAPVPHRGKRNEPVYVKETVKKIAEIRGEDPEHVKNTLVNNAIRVFRLKMPS